ncbi:MAG TPA: nucleotidyltransferase domain-containing protein [Anaerolineae bacterium]|nr:nucleotidyltransferase domain-containing protein [Anaerolineae bacterium]
METLIKQHLVEIEKEHDVKILYACESGSRAWGFPSADSDYDVRFIYAHRRDWYLSIRVERKRDVIELPINDSLDISGWDIRKTLNLFAKTNPPLYEWLDSPIVYAEDYPTAGALRALIPEFYNPIACSYHYHHMADGNYRSYMQGEEVWIKKYFYILRPLLAIRWIEAGRGVAPTPFGELVAQAELAPALERAIGALIAAKKEGAELDRGPRIPVISDFIDAEMARLAEKRFELELVAPKQTIEPLDALFRETLEVAW